MSGDVFDDLATRLGPTARRGAPFGSSTTYRVGGPAAIRVEIDSIERLNRVAEVLCESAVPVVVLGRGSNMLVSDEGFPGVAVVLGEFATRIELPTSDVSGGNGTDDVVVVGGAAWLPVVARRSAAAGWSGFEWAVGVPGSIGGAVRMNAGGHGSDMRESLVDVDVVSLADARSTRRSVHDLGLAFRHSNLGDCDVVVSARVRVRRDDPARTQRTIDEIVKWRRENQPGGQNAGSVFVNPVPGEVSAGELIDRAGLRGFRIGSAEVSTKHANFIQADEGGTAADVRAVMRHVHDTVLARFGHDLRSEIRLVGFAEESS